MKNLAQLQKRLFDHTNKQLQLNMFYSDLEFPEFVEVKIVDNNKMLFEVNSFKFYILDSVYQKTLSHNDKHVYKKEFYYHKDNINIIDNETFEILRHVGDKIFKYKFKFL